MTQGRFDSGVQSDFGYGQLFAILWRRRFWFFGVFCGVMAIAIPVALSKEPTYQSSMQLLVEPNYEDEQGENEFTDSSVDIDYATQLNLMRSSGLIQQAVAQLTPKYPDLDVEEIKDSLTLYQVVEDKVYTKIFQADYTSDGPLKAQNVLQAIQEVYQEYNLDQQEKRLAEGLSFITEQLPVVREDLIEAEETLKQFRTEHNLIAPAEEAIKVSEDFREIQQQREALRAQYEEVLARFNDLQQKLGQDTQNVLASTRLSESSRYQTLLDQLQETELVIAEQGAKFTEASPMLQDLIEQRQNQRQLLQAEVERVLGEVPAQLNINEAALQKEGQLGDTDLSLARGLVEAQTDLMSLQARDQSLVETEAKFRDQLKRYPNLIAEYNNLEQEVEVKRNTLQQLLEARQELGIEINRGGFNWQVVEPPRPGWQVDPNTQQDLLLGGVVAVFLGGVAAFAREAIDDAVRSSDQLKGQVALPLLGATPKLPQPEMHKFLVNMPWRSSLESTPAILEVVQWIPFRESLDLIYKNIQLLNTGLPLRSLTVTSALPGEGKSTLVLGLALSAARLHRRVLVIDADLRRSSLHKQLDLPNEAGLSTLLAGETGLSNLHHLSLLNSSIDVLTAGPTPADPVKLLSSGRLEELIETFEQSYDLVLIDTPPVLGTVDAIQTASCCSGVVIVGRLDRVTQSELSQATALLSKLNAIGIIANGARAANSYLPLTEPNHSSPTRQPASNEN